MHARRHIIFWGWMFHGKMASLGEALKAGKLHLIGAAKPQ